MGAVPAAQFSSVIEPALLCDLLVLFLVLHIRADLRLVQTYRVDAIPPCPEMIAPVWTSFQLSKLVEHSNCRPPIQRSNKVRD